MPDDIKALKINIETTQTGSGAADAANELEKVADKTKGAGKEAEHAGEHHRVLNQVLRMLGRETVPELGEAIHGSLYGGLGFALAAGAAFEFLEKKIEAAHEKAAEFLTLNWKAALEASDKLRENIDDLDEALKKAGKDADPIKTEFQEQLAILNAQVKAHETILKTIEKEQLGLAGGDPVKEAQIREHFERLTGEVGENAGRTRRGLIGEEILKRTADQADLNDAAKAAAAAVAAMKIDPELLAAKAGSSDKSLDSIAARFSGFIGSGAAGATVEGMGGAGALINFIVGKLQGSQLEAANKMLTEWQKNAETVSSFNEKIRLLEESFTTQKGKAEENAKINEELSKTLHSQIEVSRQESAGSEINRAIEIALRAKSGGKLNTGEAGFLTNVGTVAAGHTVDLTTAEHMFQYAAKNQQVLDGFLTRLFNALSNMPDFSKYESRIRAIETNIERQNSRSSTPPPAVQN